MTGVGQRTTIGFDAIELGVPSGDIADYSAATICTIIAPYDGHVSCTEGRLGDEVSTRPDARWRAERRPGRNADLAQSMSERDTHDSSSSEVTAIG